MKTCLQTYELFKGALQFRPTGVNMFGPRARFELASPFLPTEQLFFILLFVCTINAKAPTGIAQGVAKAPTGIAQGVAKAPTGKS